MMMTQFCPRRMLRLNLKKRILWRATALRRYVRLLWKNVLACWIGRSIRYRQLTYNTMPSPSTAVDGAGLITSTAAELPSPSCECDAPSSDPDSSDLVALKICLFGDPQIGKTSFLAQYLGTENVKELKTPGLHKVDKTLCVRGARISYTIWDVEGDQTCQNLNHLPAACKDSVAVIFMFDLTSRRTLNSVISWYKQARKWNQTAFPVLVGTKFDDFVQLPLDLQWTIASEARAYAKALNATLFFSSATYNINVNKIFKFITAKLFNLPWTLERNLTIGEPIIDF